MLEKLQQFLKTTGGRIAAGGLFFAAIALVAYSFRGATEDSRFASFSNDRVYVCAESGKPFPHTVTLGETYPVLSPHSGKKTGYPAEYCYWTADGKAKKEPTPVLLNSMLGKPGRTFCPDCKRLVVVMNPPPVEGAKPPPKESEIKPGAAPGVDEENRGE
jgi:hypothetical protein